MGWIKKDSKLGIYFSPLEIHFLLVSAFQMTVSCTTYVFPKAKLTTKGSLEVGQLCYDIAQRILFSQKAEGKVY